MGFVHGHQYTAEEVDFILDNYQTQTLDNLLIMFNNLFPPGVTKASIRNKIQQLSISKRNLQSNFGKYTEEMIDWLKENYQKRTFANFEDLTEVFNKRFGTSFTKSAIWHKLNRTIDNQIVRQAGRVLPRTNWTPKMLEYLKENFCKYTNSKLAVLMSEKFKCYITSSSLEHKATRLGLRKSFADIAKYRGPNPGGFKKGLPSSRRVPLGGEVVRKGGYTWVKTKMPNTFRQKHKVIYEAHYGAIPEGHVVIFLTGDKKDFRLENLVALSRAELMHFNKLKLQVNGDMELGQLKLDLARLNKSIGEKKNAKK